MSIQYTYAGKNEIFVATDLGRQYHIDIKLRSNESYKNKVPSRWFTNEWVTKEVIDNGKKV